MKADSRLAEALRAGLPGAIDEVIAEIGREVPEYARPLEGNFGRNVRVGVEEALGRFVERVADPDAAAAHDPRVYVALGRGEFREGRSMNALLQAYRVGARVAWRRLSAAALAAGVEGERIAALAESVFEYIDELSAESAEGFALEQEASAGERQRLRERVVGLLLGDPPAEPAAVARAAEEVGWEVPAELAVVAIAADGEEPAAAARRVGPSAIGASVEGRGVVVLGDPAGPGVRARVERALGDGRGAIGPGVSPGGARRSFERAVGALELVADGGLVVAEEHLPVLLIGRDRALAGELAARALGPLEGLPEGRRARLRETLAAGLENDRQPTPTAAALHLHPQTVRYRVRQLRDLFGDALDDPERRFELTVALRVREDGRS